LGRVALVIVLVCIATLAAVPFKACAEDPPPCERCGGSGKGECKKHVTFARLGEKGFTPLADVSYAEYPCCYGTGFVPCTACGGKKWREFLATYKEESDKLIVDRNAVIKKIFGEKPPRKIYSAKTKHFILTCDIKERSEGLKFTAQNVSWLMLARLEKAYDQFLKFVGAEKEGDVKFWEDQPRCFYIWLTADEQKQASQSLTGITNEVSTVYKPFFTSMVENEFDGHTHHFLVHNAFHLLSEGMEPWADRAIPEWMGEGISNWGEQYLFMEVSIGCIGEGMTPWDINVPLTDWRALVLKMIKEKKTIPLGNYAKCNIKELTTDQRVQSFAIVDYIYSLDNGKKMNAFLVRLKETKDQFRAIKEVLDCSSSELDEKWVAWASEAYKKQKK